jgi:hypothetical protein
VEERKKKRRAERKHTKKNEDQSFRVELRFQLATNSGKQINQLQQLPRSYIWFFPFSLWRPRKAFGEGFFVVVKSGATDSKQVDKVAEEN